jgi:hypothetical protein
MPKTISNQQSALLSIEKVLTLLRSVQTLEGTDKDGVEHLLEMAAEKTKEVKKIGAYLSQSASFKLERSR